jgi:hypothetical protein
VYAVVSLVKIWLKVEEDRHRGAGEPEGYVPSGFFCVFKFLTFRDIQRVKMVVFFIRKKPIIRELILQKMTEQVSVKVEHILRWILVITGGRS